MTDEFEPGSGPSFSSLIFISWPQSNLAYFDLFSISVWEHVETAKCESAAKTKAPAKHVFRGLWSSCEIHHRSVLSVLCIFSKNHDMADMSGMTGCRSQFHAWSVSTSPATIPPARDVTRQCLPILEAWKAKPRSNPNGNRQVVQQCQRQFQTLVDRQSQPRPPFACFACFASFASFSSFSSFSFFSFFAIFLFLFFLLFFFASFRPICHFASESMASTQG